jgi:choline dehydrogenase-like flavoprotein
MARRRRTPPWNGPGQWSGFRGRPTSSERAEPPAYTRLHTSPRVSGSEVRSCHTRTRTSLSSAPVRQVAFSPVVWPILGPHRSCFSRRGRTCVKGPPLNSGTAGDCPLSPDWGFESEPDASGATSTLRRSRLLGGTSWLTRFAIRGSPADFDDWESHGNPGWSFKEVLPAFQRLETDLEFGDRDWHGDRGPLPVTRYPGLDRSSIQ